MITLQRTIDRSCGVILFSEPGNGGVVQQQIAKARKLKINMHFSCEKL
jgi:hypothetical protein